VLTFRNIQSTYVCVSVGTVTALTCAADGTLNSDHWASMCYAVTAFVNRQTETSWDYLFPLASFCTDIVYMCVYIYRVFQDVLCLGECSLRSLNWYNQIYVHLKSKFYGDNNARIMRYSSGSTYCTCLTWCYPSIARVHAWTDSKN